MSLLVNMSPLIQLVLFTLDGWSFALELGVVQRVVRAFEVTPLPNAPAVILGVINVQGELSAVVNLRHRFRLPEREIAPSDHFILVNIASPTSAQTSAQTPALRSAPASIRRIALVVDAVTGVIDVEKESIVVGNELVGDLEYVQGIARLAGELILIHNLAKCLSLDEEKTLSDALDKMEL
jgi:purine-binding chemotaxis protein CheW